MSVDMRYRPLRVLLDAHRLTHRDVVSPRDATARLALGGEVRAMEPGRVRKMTRSGSPKLRPNGMEGPIAQPTCAVGFFVSVGQRLRAS
jgi:hypothetical protein